MSAHDTPAHGDATGSRRTLVVVLSITLLILVVEVIGALVSGSLALLADAGHNLTDAVGLSMALFASVLVAKPATDRRTWGYKRAEILAAAVQAAVLLAVGGYVIVEGVRRLVEPEPVAAGAMLVFGAVSLLGNIVALLALAGKRSQNLNMRAAFLEVANDALGSVAVLVAAAVIALTGWLRADAVVSIMIGMLILPRTVRLLRESVNVLLESTPPELDLSQVRAHLLAVPHVVDVHDLHASQIATGLPVLTAHVVVEDGCFHDGHVPQLLDEVQACVGEHFPVSIEHCTFQFEAGSHVDHEPAAHE